MTRVIERLQVEADVQGGIIIDTWSDERNVDRKLTDIKSYAFTFLVQSFLPAQRATGAPRTGSPANREGLQEGDDEGVDMIEIDAILNELGVMLGRWSLYCRFVGDSCRVSHPLIEDEYMLKSTIIAGRRQWHRSALDASRILARVDSFEEDSKPNDRPFQHHDYVLPTAFCRKSIPVGRTPFWLDTEPTTATQLGAASYHVGC